MGIVVDTMIETGVAGSDDTANPMEIEKLVDDAFNDVTKNANSIAYPDKLEEQKALLKTSKLSYSFYATSNFIQCVHFYFNRTC